MARSLKPRKVKVERSARLAGKMEGMPEDFRAAKYYVHYDVEKTHYTKPIITFAEKYYGKNTSKLINSKAKRKTTYYGFQACTAYRLLNDLPVPTEYEEALHAFIKELEEDAKNAVEEVHEEEEKPKAQVKTIQERMDEKVADVCDKLDQWLEEQIELDVRAHINDLGVSQAHARKIINIYKDEIREFAEVLELPSSKLTDEQKQLKEGYSNYTKTKLKKAIKDRQLIIDECTMIVDAAKAKAKPRKKKAVSKYKQIEGIKYQNADAELKLVSENPVGIIGATEVWVYNTKTKKLGVYMPVTGGELGAKGASIVGYDSIPSVQKTIRKPEEFLKEFKKMSKTARMKAFKELKTKPSELNGRMNENILILKVV